MAEPRVTVVVVPRERFSCIPEALASVYEHTDMPFRLVYVDGGSPKRFRHYLEQQASERDFLLLRRDRYLSPNEARNIGLREVSTEYVVFLDNDVWVEPGWLEKLVECADQTRAAVVGPLTCIGEPRQDEIHTAGGEVAIVEENQNGRVRRYAKESMWLSGKKVSDVRAQLQRRQCTLAEFHCVLARTSAIEQIGGFDEEMLNTREHLDFCLEIMKAGGTIWLEPDSIVTYVPGPPFKWFDVPFYMLRWSDAWERRSLEHFREKWDVTDVPRAGVASRRGHLVRGFGRRNRFLKAAMKRSDRALNRFITSRRERGVAKAG